jgi:cardiolipin synthase
VAFVGGCNIAPEYEGDGVTKGWFDLGIRVEGELAGELAVAFGDMFARADLRHQRFIRLRKSTARKAVFAPNQEILLSGPGRGSNPIKRALRQDLVGAQEVKIMMAYFLPSWRIRRDLVRVARGGGSVQLMLAGKSDVLVAQLAGQSLYRRLLSNGVEIFEYQPQVLHAKLIIIDEAVYVGSANLDQRSLNLNYELLLRLESPELVQQARDLFSQSRQRCLPVTFESWNKTRTIWRRIKQRWAYFLLARADPYVAMRQWRALPMGRQPDANSELQTPNPSANPDVKHHP